MNNDVEPTSQPVPAVWTTPVRPSRAGTIAIATIGISVAGLALLLVFVYLGTFLGADALAFGLFLALIPLAVVLLAVHWIDRWDPEPRSALLFAFLWGAGVSIATALTFDLGVQLTIRATGGAVAPGGFLSAVIQAPMVEEFAKGFGILLVFWVVRKHFDGPIDGVVYAVTIAAGFAFSENIQYFGVALVEDGGEALGMTFLLRGIFSPFAHAMFTLCTGVAIGLAARRTRGAGAIGYFLLGLALAVALHALWNGAFFFLGPDSSVVAYYFLVQVPLFVAAIMVVVFLRRQEERTTLRRLHEYAEAGWFTRAEVSMLATTRGRRQARAWAAGQSRAKRLAMRRFIADATRLAFAREKLLHGHPGAPERAYEAELLGRLNEDRAQVLD